jgi:hypothetical protein
MPEFVNENQQPSSSLLVHFATPEDRRAFAALVEQKLTPHTRAIWYPPAEIGRMMDKRWRAWDPKVPTAPLYVVSKGRWQTSLRMTSRVLHQMGVPHYMVVEESEADDYARVLDSSASVLVLDPAYQRDYDPADELGQTKSLGPGPARNFAWDHARASGASWHWVMDDNISLFYRFNRNLQVPLADGTGFRVMEDFAARYQNVAMAGPQYFMFIARKNRMPPFVPNTRIYSCNLIRNDLPFRWRGRYNEDTDLSLRMLKAGWCTIQYNAFTQHKTPTQTTRGGNTDAFYATEGTRPKSEMLARLHPDVARVVWKWGRWHHEVNYKPWHASRQPLRRRPALVVAEGTDEYGLVLERQDPYGNWVPDLSRRWDRDMPLGDLQLGMAL